MKPRKQRICPACYTPIRKDDAVSRGKHADCDPFEPKEHRSPSNSGRYNDKREAFTVTGQRVHEQRCTNCHLDHAGECF